MPHSAEKHVSLGPLDFDVGIRAIQLSLAFSAQDPTPGRAASAVRRADPHRVGGIRPWEDNVLDWESEGGSLG
jgi:hypothetical protein